MRGRRARREREEEVRRLYPQLLQFLGGYLHQDWDLDHGTPENAVRAAIGDSSIEIWQQVRRQLREVLGEEDDAELREDLDALGIQVFFKHASEARAFAQEVEQMLLASIEQHFQQQRK